MKNDDFTPRPNPDPTSTLDDLFGYDRLGMKRHSLRMARKLLLQHRVLPIQFDAAVRTLGMFLSNGAMRKWREMLETAYARQSKRSRCAMNASMLKYYSSLDDWENAARFISADQMKSPADAFMLLEVLLETNRMDEAKHLARIFERWLGQKHDRFTFALIITALGEYYQRIGELDKALNIWKHAPLEEPFRRNALAGVVKIHLARALMSARTGLQALDALKKSPDQETSLSLPGNDDEITQEAEKHLLRYKRGIEKLLPMERRNELGFYE